jgi:hypothetical protein
MKMEYDFLFELLFLCIFIVNEIANAIMIHISNLGIESKINSKKNQNPYLESFLSIESNWAAIKI